QLVVADAGLSVRMPLYAQEAGAAVVDDMPLFQCGQLFVRGSFLVAAHDVPVGGEILLFARRKLALGALPPADVGVHGIHAQTDLDRLFTPGTFLGTRGTGAAPLYVEEHQEVLASGLPGVLSQSELGRRLPLLQEIDGLAQRLGELLQFEIAHGRARLQSGRKARSLRSTEIDGQRWNRARRRGLHGEPDQRRPLLEPAFDEIHLPHREGERIGEAREYRLYIAFRAARVR